MELATSLPLSHVLRPSIILINDAEKCQHVLREQMENEVCLAGSEDDGVEFNHLETKEPFISLLAAQTCLIVPLEWEGIVEQVASLLLEKTIEDPVTGKSVPLWELATSPPEAMEFSPHFRLVSGVGEGSMIQRLRMSEQARKPLFAKARVWGVDKSSSLIGKACSIDEICLVVFSHGILAYLKVNWMEASTKEWSLNEWKKWIHLSKFPNIVVGVSHGWTFGENDDASTNMGIEWKQLCLGPALHAARFRNIPCALLTVVNWLVMFRDDTTPRARISCHAVSHHSVARVSGKIDLKDHAQLLLLHQIAHQGGESAGISTDDGVLLEKGTSRCVYVCQEGTLALQWSPHASFTSLFMGAYLFLALHVLAEKHVLNRLSFLTATISRQLFSASTLREEGAAKEVLHDLCARFIRHNLSVSSAHCGGRPQFGGLLRSLRLVHRTQSLRAELREDIRGALRLIDSEYHEDQRRLAAFDRHRELQEQIKREHTAKDRRQRDTFQLIATVGGAIFLPFTIISGIFGMNNSYTPIDTSWPWILGGTGIGCFVLICLLVCIFCATRPSKHHTQDQLHHLDSPSYHSKNVSSYAHGGNPWQARGAATVTSPQ